MRRRILLLLMIVLLVTGSGTGVHASTDCQRWFIAYKKQFAQSQSAKRLLAAKARARRYAQMKLAGYIKPQPVAKPHRQRPRRPRMSRAELLRRLDLACGVLPERTSDQPIIKEENLEGFISKSTPDVPLLPVSDDQQLIASNEPLQFPLMGETPDYSTQSGPFYMPPFGSGGGYPGMPGIPFPPRTPPPLPPVAPVPEPGSFILLLTGLVGGASETIRRLAASRA
ncbi:MAG: PEP-CTERM sorting domain-containing protein [Edaphobacter sp.]